MSEPAVLVEGLVKRYGSLVAVDDLSLRVEQGELLGLLGPNGAGKTTTVEILEGYRKADAGTVRVLGLDPWRDGPGLKPRLGLMLQQGGIYPTARPIEVLRLFAGFFEDPLDPREVLRLVGLDDAARTRYRALSGGQKQRLSLGLALIGRPQILFLDEPTAAMDPQARRATWDLIRGLRQDGATIVLTTHFMEEAERLADRVAIVDHGRLLALDTPEALVRAAGSGGFRFRTRPGLDLATLHSTLGAARVYEEESGEYVVATEPTPERIANLATWLRDQGALLGELRAGAGSLEDVFLALTGRELRD